jgi:hypothetical protein
MDNFANSVIGKVLEVRTVGHSMYGNPTKDIAIKDEQGNVRTYRTTANSQLAYSIGNAEYRDELHEFGLTKAGRLNGYTRKVN